MDYSKNSTIKEQEGRHCATIMPIWGVQDVEIKEHFPYHWSFITLLLPGNKFQKSSSGLNLNNKQQSTKKIIPQDGVGFDARNSPLLLLKGRSIFHVTHMWGRSFYAPLTHLDQRFF